MSSENQSSAQPTIPLSVIDELEKANPYLHWHGPSLDGKTTWEQCVSKLKELLQSQPTTRNIRSVEEPPKYAESVQAMMKGLEDLREYLGEVGSFEDDVVKRDIMYQQSSDLLNALNIIKQYANANYQPVTGTTSQPSEWQLCPKCNGQGSVSKPPYVAGDVNEWTSSATSFVCNVCNGAKVLVKPIISQPLQGTASDLLDKITYDKGEQPVKTNEDILVKALEEIKAKFDSEEPVIGVKQIVNNALSSYRTSVK